MSGPEELVGAAQLAYFHGRDRDAVTLCEQALDLLDAEPVRRPEPRVRALHVLLSATQRWWGAEGSPQRPTAELVAAVLATADDSGDPLLKSMARHAQGAYLIATNSLPEAISVLEESVRYARESGDPLAQVDAIAELGHHMAGRDLLRTLELLTEAHALVDGLDSRDIGVLVRSGRIAGFLGVGHFDAGNFDEGESWLRRALADLETAGILDQFLMMSNYLGQLLVAAGRFAEGREVLGRAIDRTPREPDASTHLGYNLGLLGKLELESGRPAEAAGPINEGWRHLRQTQHASVRPILRNYLAELLIHPGYERRAPAAADRLLVENEEDARRTGFLRSELNALILHAQVRLELGDLPGAVTLAEQAAIRLEKVGALPALRSEEVHLVHHDVLRRAGRDADAQRALARARDILLAKAETMADPEHRRAFLTRVPVSAAILAATDRWGS
ncbi:hypothetical protein [Micromonospora foliorum]|uniref:hypothetical protein n=1 Tax=Micromonospora foliorum TaxID=2911210 RepID=UPI001EE961C5|nr:hypothetical protein [Micromonospora foliorum]MCG5435239.1 hypothetical protein [Micromonospora foliorum]